MTVSEVFTGGAKLRWPGTGRRSAAAAATRIGPPWVNTTTVASPATSPAARAAASTSACHTRRRNSANVSPPPRRTSSPRPTAASTSGYSAAISVKGRPAQEPMSASRSRASSLASRSKCRRYAFAVSLALGRSLETTRSGGPNRASSAAAATSACSRPVAVSPESDCPW